MYYTNNKQEEFKKYAEAKSDMIKALRSFDELTPQQKNQLINELVVEQIVGTLIHNSNDCCI